MLRAVAHLPAHHGRGPAMDTLVLAHDERRLRRKLVVLKIEKWIASYLRATQGSAPALESAPYAVDMSSKNPRWRPRP